MPAHVHHPAAGRLFTLGDAVSGARPARAGKAPAGTGRVPSRPAPEPLRDLAASVEPAFVPARGDAAAGLVRDRIASELVKSRDLGGVRGSARPDLEGLAVSVTAARLPAAPLALVLPFGGTRWAARLQRTEWTDRGTARLVYELRRFTPDDV